MTFTAPEKSISSLERMIPPLKFFKIDAFSASFTYTHRQFITTVLDILSQRLAFMQEKELVDLIEKNKTIPNFNRLSAFFTEMIVKSRRKVVFTIDEVDKASNNQLFLDFLGMLRKKYLMRNEGKDHSFHSVILAGVHDVKTLKAKIRPDAEQKYIVELKIWRGEAYHQDGISQLYDYLDRQNQGRGYLLIYDLRKETGKQGVWEKIEKQGKEIYAAWV